LALRHQVAVLERQLGGEKVRILINGHRTVNSSSRKLHRSVDLRRGHTGARFETLASWLKWAWSAR
jgi:hypothetical protein